jgi:iron-sulfur cluster repair protein YtfE (RIC family)
MAKRHVSLIPLARDHYHGLLLAVRLQQGEQALPRLWSHDPQWQADYVVDFYEKDLKHHFEAEERGLFPYIADVKGASSIVEELLQEHRTFERFVGNFRREEQATLVEQLRDFGARLEEHIRKEDRVLFPLLEERAPADVLMKVAEFMKDFYPPEALTGIDFDQPNQGGEAS